MAQGGIQQAHQLLERMKLTKVPLEPYIESNVVEAMYKVRVVSLHAQQFLLKMLLNAFTPPHVIYSMLY